jgi:hypothetical protein
MEINHVLEVGSGLQSEEFCFHAEESAQHLGEEICVENRKKTHGTLV